MPLASRGGHLRAEAIETRTEVQARARLCARDCFVRVAHFPVQRNTASVAPVVCMRARGPRNAIASVAALLLATVAPARVSAFERHNIRPVQHAKVMLDVRHARQPRGLRDARENSAASVALTVAPLMSTSRALTTVVTEPKPAPRGLIIFAVAMFIVGASLAAAETAITTLWPWKVRELAEKEGPKSPFSVLDTDLTRFLTTILVTTTASTVFSTAIATDFAGEMFGPSGVAYFTAGMTIFFLFFGEILPKALAVHSPARVARVMVPVIGALSMIVYPLGKLLAAISTQILHLLKLPMESDLKVSEEELRLIVAGADRSGSIEKYESQIIKNVLDLEETAVREIMCPRVDMLAIPATAVLAELLSLESDSRYSRMPCYDGSVDNIIGIVYAKSLLRYLTQQSELLQTTQVAEIIDPAFFVPESMSVWIVLEEMRKRRLHMAIVVDEYGGTAGLVTLEDILEEVVGEIYDEDDDYEAELQDIHLEADGRYRMEGQADLEKVHDKFDLGVSEDDLREYGTISGFLCAKMGGIPEAGDAIVFGGMKFTVADADDRRIVTLFASPTAEIELEKRREGNGEADSDSKSGENGDNPLHKLIASIGNGVADNRTNESGSELSDGNAQNKSTGGHRDSKPDS